MAPIRPAFDPDLSALVDGAVRELRSRRRWLLDPTEFAHEVIGPEALEMAASRPVLHFSPDQKAFLAAFCDVRIPKVLLRTGRGGSKTFLAAIGIAAMAYCIPGFTCTVLAGSLEQGRILYHDFETFATSRRFATCLQGEPTKTLTAIGGGGWVRVLTASEKQVKGPHPAMLVMDEACAADPDILELAMGQRLGSTLGLLRAQSTPDKLFHPFRDWWSKADEQGWRTFHWGSRAFQKDGSWEPTLSWVPREAVDEAISTQDSNWVRIHVDGEFGSATGTVFRWEDVQAAQIESIEADPLYSVEATASVRIGVDWGMEHPTVITVSARVTVPPDIAKLLELRSPEMFYIVHVEGWTHRSEDFLYGRIADILKTWKGDLYLDSSHPFQNEAVGRVARAAAKAAHPIAFSKDKMSMVGYANMLLEQKRLRIPKRFIETLEQLSSYSWDEGKEKPMKVNDDYVDSLILSLWGHRLGAGGPPGAARIKLGRPGR